jgi:hypothetical protein
VEVTAIERLSKREDVFVKREKLRVAGKEIQLHVKVLLKRKEKKRKENEGESRPFILPVGEMR